MPAEQNAWQSPWHATTGATQRHSCRARHDSPAKCNGLPGSPSVMRMLQPNCLALLQESKYLSRAHLGATRMTVLHMKVEPFDGSCFSSSSPHGYHYASSSCYSSCGSCYSTFSSSSLSPLATAALTVLCLVQSSTRTSLPNWRASSGDLGSLGSSVRSH